MSLPKPFHLCMIRKLEGTQASHSSSKGDKNTHTYTPIPLTHTLPACLELVEFARISAGTCSLPRDPCHGGGDGSVLSPRLEMTPGWEEPVID